MPKLLLVDADPRTTQELAPDVKRVLQDWDVLSTSNYEEADKLLDAGDLDVIITDLHLGPNAHGEQLLGSALLHQPGVSRIILSANSQRSSVLRAFGKAHQVIEKPCTAEQVANTVERVFALRRHLASPEIRRIVNQVEKLPTLPANYLALTTLLNQEDYVQGEVVRLLNQDMSIAATVLKVANSVFFGRRYPVTSLDQALMILGTTTIKTIVLSRELFSKISARHTKEFGLEELWRHSLQVAKYAQTMGRKAILAGEITEDAFAAGLLHDIGKLVLVQTMPNEYRKVLEVRNSEGIPFDEAEEMVLGVTHADVGGYLLGTWGMPDSIVEAAVYHHHPLACQCRDITVLGLVCAANAVDHARNSDHQSPLSTAEYEEYLNDSGADEILAAWREIAESDE